MSKPFEIECPHCREVFPIPKKRHILSREKGFWGNVVTLCGIDVQNMSLIAKEGETPNCKACLRKPSTNR